MSMALIGRPSEAGLSCNMKKNLNHVNINLAINGVTIPAGATSVIQKEKSHYSFGSACEAGLSRNMKIKC